MEAGSVATQKLQKSVAALLSGQLSREATVDHSLQPEPSVLLQVSVKG